MFEKAKQELKNMQFQGTKSQNRHLLVANGDFAP
jgi:hypothetical protein